MDRRKFVKSSLLSGPILGTTLLAGSSASLTDNHPVSPARGKSQQWYELRTYLFANDTQLQLTSAYLEQAYLPALNRAGIRNIGVFTETQPQGAAQPQSSTQPQSPASPAKTFLLIPFDSINSFAAIPAKLAADAAYAVAGAAYLSALPANPAYQRIESALLKAFEHMPSIEVPEKKDRLFELRCYESPTESAGQKKIEMFNTAGEINIFKKAGARPVFFGETIIGDRRPNLTYLLCFDNMEAHDTHWKAFGSDPEWKKISTMPEYLDAKLISKITRTFLSPTGYSQV